MSRPLHDLNIRRHAPRSQRLDGAHALLPRNHIVRSAVDQEGRGAIGAGEDLGVGGDGRGLGLRGSGRVRGGGGPVEEEGDGLRAPVHVQDEAPARIRERHEHTWVVDVGGRVVARDLG